MTDLRRVLLEKFPLKPGLEPLPEETLLEPKWVLGFKDMIYQDNFDVDRTKVESEVEAGPNVRLGRSVRLPEDTISRRLNVTLKQNHRFTPESHWQDVRELLFTSSAIVDYEPGDILTIHPHNSTQDVDAMLDLMGWNTIADKEICFYCNTTNVSHGLYPPPPLDFRSEASSMSFRKLLTEFLDLNAIPKRSFFSWIVHLTEDQIQKERLLEFTKTEYMDELYDYTTRPRRSILEVLQEFDTVKIPWEWAANILPELRGRQFSIASGGRRKNHESGHVQFDLLVAIVRYKTVIKKIREGVCTRYLASLPEGSLLDVTLQKGSLGVLRSQAERPLVMVGPGTGIAPIRSLIWERLQWAEEAEPQRDGLSNGVAPYHRSVGEMALFFGCRNKDADYFYRQEWENLKESLPLQVFTAFSRDQKQKVYVQNLIKEQSSLVYRLLHDLGGIVYVCGSSGRMPKAVRIALTEAFAEAGCMHQGDAEALLQAMEKEGRYKQETW